MACGELLRWTGHTTPGWGGHLQRAERRVATWTQGLVLVMTQADEESEGEGWEDEESGVGQRVVGRTEGEHWQSAVEALRA